ncbi:hypothetical protein S40285_10934 [Stachybotrys chlorohalonatus IBT 40285]|uniref:Uncharacterized protein n=1 Tax=Stachybotrys chlorohalonatus (strain IBT 40285) TaxID=1283841 RepID=A0A084QU94_STAC4|nr:hypothetical protein S40285_10934 [Stachybotrys chlorohalonata IBT 40285]
MEGLEVSANKALKYSRTRDDLVRLGRALGGTYTRGKKPNHEP